MARAAGVSLVLASLLLAPASAQAARPKEDAARSQLQEAEHAREAELAAQKAAAARAAEASAELEKLNKERADATARLRDAEEATEAAATQIEQLTRRREQADAKLAARAKDVAPLLPLIERLSLYPSETLLAIPAPLEDRLRGILVLQGLARRLETEAEALRKDKAEADAARQALAAERQKYADARARQEARAAELDKAIAAADAVRSKAEAEAEAAAKRAAAEAARADTLRGLLSKLEAERRAEEARAKEEAARAERQKKDAEAAAAKQKLEASRRSGSGTLGSGSHPKGQLTIPVAGTVVRGWGDPTEGGPAMGLSYQGAPGARVVSACSGRVVFAQPFRSYGPLLIIDCGGDYHVVMSGFARLDANEGETVQAGDPVGIMPSWEPGVSGRRPTLYVELRHDGQPVNPAPWIRASG